MSVLQTPPWFSSDPNLSVEEAIKLQTYFSKRGLVVSQLPSPDVCKCGFFVPYMKSIKSHWGVRPGSEKLVCRREVCRGCVLWQ